MSSLTSFDSNHVVHSRSRPGSFSRLRAKAHALSLSGAAYYQSVPLSGFQPKEVFAPSLSTSLTQQSQKSQPPAYRVSRHPLAHKVQLIQAQRNQRLKKVLRQQINQLYQKYPGYAQFAKEHPKLNKTLLITGTLLAGAGIPLAIKLISHGWLKQSMKQSQWLKQALTMVTPQDNKTALLSFAALFAGFAALSEYSQRE